MNMARKIGQEAHSKINNIFSIGKSQRSGFKKADTPGPGQYYNYESTNYKFAHTKEPRSK